MNNDHFLRYDEQNKQIRKFNRIQTNYDYRKYLTTNASNIIAQNNQLALEQVCPQNIETNVSMNYGPPRLYQDCANNFGDITSDLKHNYVTQNFVNKNSFIPIIKKQ